MSASSTADTPEGQAALSLVAALAPFTLALVLGNRAEDAFRLSMIGSCGDMRCPGRTDWLARSRRWQSLCGFGR
jgi:hypothetical protein